jgi:hypothetical protein
MVRLGQLMLSPRQGFTVSARCGVGSLITLSIPSKCILCDAPQVFYGGNDSERLVTDPVLRALGAPALVISIEGPVLGVYGA